MTRSAPNSAVQSPADGESRSSPTAWSAQQLRQNPHFAQDKADRVQRMFAAIARSYDLNNRLHSLGRDQAWRRTAVGMCDVRATDKVLDVACGTGDLTEAFADAGAASVVGLDFTEEMLSIARQKSSRAARAANRCIPEYVRGDAIALPFDNESFDVVSIAFGIRNVSDPAAALREFRRVLAAGGRMVILEFSQPRNPLIRAVNAFYCAHVMPITASLIARDRSGAYRYLPRSVQTFLSTDQLISLMRGAGFDAITVRPLTFGVCTAYVGCVS